MKKKLLIAGATGDLGGRIANELLKKGVEVRAIVRKSSKLEKVNQLKDAGVEVLVVNMENKEELEKACYEISCVISTVAGLGETIVDFQSRLVEAAVAAKVPRFIPSDFSTDFTQMDIGLNRNFDLRKKFRRFLDKQPIKATSIFNGAFAYVLNYNLPLFNTKEGTVIYYNDKQDFTIDFSTIENTASFTAFAALDDSTPRDLYIASFSLSPAGFASAGKKIYNKEFKLVNGGSLENFGRYIAEKRKANPEGEQKLYADWQQMQYLHNMFLVHHLKIDNNRYPEIEWTSLEKSIQHFSR